MTARVPDWWQFAVLALAAYRIYRLGARDTITEPLRAKVSYPDDQAITLDDSPFTTPEIEVVGAAPEFPKGWRIYLATLIRCPWCAGFYVSATVWIAWVIWPLWTLFLAVPWALSCVLGIAKKNLDG